MENYPKIKKPRQKELIKAVLSLCKEYEYEDITMSAIADKLNFSRANLYKHVKTKDEILVWILLDDMNAWVADLEKELTIRGSLTKKEFSTIWAETMYKNKRLIYLLSKYNSTMKKHITNECYDYFENGYDILAKKLVETTKKYMPIMSIGKIEDFVKNQFYLVQGLYYSTVSTGKPNERINKFVPVFVDFAQKIL